MTALKRSAVLVSTFVAAALAASYGAPEVVKVYSVAQKGYITVEKVVKSDAEWKKILTPEQFEIMRGQGTERVCNGFYWKNHADGVYKCAACGNDLFQSVKKFDSGTGWPSFFGPVDPANVITRPDNSFGMQRTEVLCARCNSHLGHVFDDGPAPSGLRYCINSVALKFVPKDSLKS